MARSATCKMKILDWSKESPLPAESNVLHRPRLCENAKTISRECDALRFDTLGAIRIERTAAKLTSTSGHFAGSMSFHTASTRCGRSFATCRAGLGLMSVCPLYRKKPKMSLSGGSAA